MSTTKAAAAQAEGVYSALVIHEKAVSAALQANTGLPLGTLSPQDEDLVSWAIVRATAGISEGIGYTIESAHLAEALARESALGSYRKSDVYLSIASDLSRQITMLQDEAAKKAGVIAS